MSTDTDNEQQTGATGAANDVTDSITQSLSQFLSNSTYACGGTIKIKQHELFPYLQDSNMTNENVDANASDEPALASPVTIRWDSAHTIEKMILPLSSKDSTQEDTSITKLLQDSQPASFGFQGKDVIDETYRKASKLDTSAFSTNFCPYEMGIIDIIGQALLPRHPDQSQGIRAELYKLNIYQAPSGLFKPHVDTPRSELQFASLVVCLPCAHEGGQLIVRHQGHSTTFDWSGNVNDIQWAAFYSDCEHEVFEVISGHRITLTYNLFVRRGLGEMAGGSSGLDVQQLPLYRELISALANPLFMPEGGVLGKYCSHAYAHATAEGISALPRILKGSDMATFESFYSLGIETVVRPVIDTSGKGDELDEEYLASAHVGENLTELEAINYGIEDPLAEIYDNYPHESLEVKWLNEPTKGTDTMQFAYPRYGNDAEVLFAYSFCALFFTILPYHERVEVAKEYGYSLEQPTSTSM